MMRICDFLETNYRPSFPIPESTMYLFLCCEREAGAPVSRLKGYMQAINFCRYVFDMTELEETVNSARCKGTTRQKHVVERRQASPFWSKRYPNCTKFLRMALISGTDYSQGLHFFACTPELGGVI